MRLYDTSASWENRYWLPVCGSNGPPGLSHRADLRLSNWGYSSAGSTPLVVTYDDVVFAAAGAVSDQSANPSNGLSKASIAYGVDPFWPSPAICTMPPNQYCSTSLIWSPPCVEPRSSRQRRGSRAGLGTGAPVGPGTRQTASPCGS